MSPFRDSLEKVAAALISHAPTFEELDAAAGDGDLGITAGKIAEGIHIALASTTSDLKEDLTRIGREIAKAAPSTFGTLIATGFIRASAAIKPESSDIENLRAGLSAAFEGIASRGKAELGERTLLDALHPAVEAVKAAKTIQEGLDQAGIAARTGVIATRSMSAKHGRAGWIGERTNGIEDAGATVIAVAFETLSSK